MKKLTTATTNGIAKLQRLTIGLDLGDRSSHYCVLDEKGRILVESKVSTSPNAMKGVFGSMARSRIALETGTHSPWVSRLLSGLGHEVIVAMPQCEVDRGAAQRRSLGCADVGSSGPDRSAFAMSGEAPQR
jgi:hypothetical protein